MVWAWTSCRVQTVSMRLLQRLQALGAQEMPRTRALDKGPWLQMYTVPRNCTPLGWQITEGSPSHSWQARGGSFLLPPRRHALSSRWLLTSNHNMYEICLEEVQGAATSSLFPLPFSRVQLLCESAMLDASETWPLTKPNLQRLQQNDRAMIWLICNVKPQDFVTTRSNELLTRLAIEDLEGEKATLVWACGRLQWCSQDSLWHTGWWKAWSWGAQDDIEAADREGLQRVEAFGYRHSW